MAVDRHPINLIFKDIHPDYLSVWGRWLCSVCLCKLLTNDIERDELTDLADTFMKLRLL